MSEYFYCAAALVAIFIACLVLVARVKNSTEERMNNEAFFLRERMCCKLGETFEVECQHFIVSAASENLTQDLCSEVMRLKAAIFYKDSNQFQYDIAVKRIGDKIHHMEGLRVHYKSRSDSDLIKNIINLLYQTKGGMRMLKDINEA